MIWIFLTLALLCAFAAPFLAALSGMKSGLLSLVLWIGLAAAAVTQYVDTRLDLGIGLMAVAGISVVLYGQVTSNARRHSDSECTEAGG